MILFVNSLDVSSKLLREVKMKITQQKKASVTHVPKEPHSFSRDATSPSLYALSSDIASFLDAVEQFKQSTHKLVTYLRKHCPSRSSWFITCLINFLALHSCSTTENDFRYLMLSENLSSIICASDPSYATNPAPKNKELLLPVLEDIDDRMGPRWECIVVTSLRLDLLLHVEFPDMSTPSAQAKFLFPNLLRRTLLFVHALKSRTQILMANDFQELLSVEINHDILSRGVQTGAGGMFMPLVTELLCWYIDEFLQITSRPVVLPLDDLMRYICACLALLDANNTDASQVYHVWSVGLVVCHPVRLQLLLLSIQNKGRRHLRKQQYAVFVLLRMVKIILDCPPSSPGILCPSLALNTLCNQAVHMAKGISRTEVLSARSALNDRLALSWAAVKNGSGRLTRPPLASSFYHSTLNRSSSGNPQVGTVSLSSPVDLLVWLPVASPGGGTIPSGSTFIVTLEVSKNKFPSHGESVSIRCRTISTSILLYHCSTMLVLPDTSLLWNTLLFPPPVCGADVSPSPTGFGMEVMEVASAVQQLHVKVYLPLLFQENRYSMIRTVALTISRAVCYHEVGNSSSYPFPRGEDIMTAVSIYRYVVFL